MGIPTSRHIWSSDILHVLDLFTLLTNVTKAQIHLPDSLNDDKILQSKRQDVEEVMMRVKPLDYGHRQWLITIERVIADNERAMMYATGRFSQAKLCIPCGLGHWISETHLDIFEKVWPHRDLLTEWPYKPRSEYLGDKSLENAPLSHLNHRRTDSYNRDLAKMFGFEY